MKGRWIEYREAELAFIKAHCKLTRRELTEHFNTEFGRNLSVANIASLCKRKGWLTGRDGRFNPGHLPHPNARPKGPNRTSFKKGNSPANERPLWSERVNKDGYIEIKVPERNPHTGSPTRFKHKHVWLWEQQHGPVPAQHAIVFKDGNRLNCELDNLECVHRRVLQTMNKCFKASEYPEQVRPSLLALSQLKSEINHVRKKSQKQGEQPCNYLRS